MSDLKPVTLFQESCLNMIQLVVGSYSSINLVIKPIIYCLSK